MSDFLSDNIFILIPIVLVAVVNILRALKKQSETRDETQDTPSGKTGNRAEKWMSLADDDTGEGLPGLGHWETGPDHTPPARRSLVSAVPRARPFTGAVLAPALVDSVSRSVDLGHKAASGPGGGVPVLLPDRIERLSALKKALVLSEILSPPRALRRE